MSENNLNLIIETEQINVEILENNFDLTNEANSNNIEFAEINNVIEIVKINNIIEIVESNNEVIVSSVGIQGATGDSNILGKSPIFTYNSNGTLASVVYANGAAKTFTYNSDSRLSYLNSTSEFGIITQKTFNYNSDGYLTSIVEIEL